MTTHYTADFARIVAEPELTYTPNGHAVCKLRVAVNHSKKDRATDQWQDTGTTWISISIFGKNAEPAAAHLAKGDAVHISGQLVTRDYEKKDGTKGSSLELEYATVSKLIPAQTNHVAPKPPAPAPAASTASAWGATSGGPF